VTNRQHDHATGSTPLQPLLDYHARPGLMTDPHELAPLLDGLPHDIPSLVQVVQGVLVHIFWAERYGLALSEERKGEVQMRTLPQKLRRVRELDDHPLSVARPLEKRLVGNCRDFAVLLCALLQRQGVPARGRCGFGVYFLPNHYEDHWVCEYWNAEQQRWVLVDAQLDTFQREAMHIPFDPLDVPRAQYLTGGRAWQMCRSGQEDPDKFGIFEWHGLYFVRGDLIRDFLALNKIEILPWDGWGLMAGPEQALTAEDAAILERMAALTLAGDEAFNEIRALYENDSRLRMAPDWRP
jgi:hypothetical protein